jgi:hypothetical protein
MTRLLLVIGVLLPGLPSAGAEGICDGESVAASRAELDGYVASFSTDPEEIPIGDHFTVSVSVCRPGGGTFEGSLVVDADMPSHGHGMNYRPEVRELAAGRFQAEGFLFHMPGEWRFLFTLDDGSARRTLEAWRSVP